MNPDAFTTPTSYEQGNLGRNVVHGFRAWQIDFSIRRRISIGERAAVDIGLQGFNVTNQPSFAGPSALVTGNLSSPAFGTSTNLLGGEGSFDQTGRPRSFQLGLRVDF